MPNPQTININNNLVSTDDGQIELAICQYDHDELLELISVENEKHHDDVMPAIDAILTDDLSATGETVKRQSSNFWRSGAFASFTKRANVKANL